MHAQPVRLQITFDVKSISTVQVKFPLCMHIWVGVLSSNALSSKEHWSNGTLVEWNIGRMELWSNGTLVERNILLT